LLNLHYLFHHDYYNNPTESNEALTKRQFEPGSREIPFTEQSKIKGQSFVLKTQYPGLLLGLGYPHDDGKSNNDAVKLGFSLDYVSGLPVIPGSTVKGVLRSLFRRKEAHECIKSLGNLSSVDDVMKLEKELFTEDSKDVYFDAYPITEKKSLLAFESITPHHEKNLKDPNPIRLLKVPPEVEFLFRFQLHDGGQLKADEKLDLFKELLKLTGIGAKTNVGFGGLAEGTPQDKYIMLEMCGGGAKRAAPAQGICGACGKPTKQNKAGIYYELCFDCNQRKGN